jgi:hypothetical protein
MQIASLLKLLNDFADLTESLGAASTARAVKDLRKLFSGREDSTITKYLGELSKRKPIGHSIESETISDVRALLSRLQELFLNAECKSAAKDVALLATLLEGCDHSTIAEFVAGTSSWGTKPRGRINDRIKDLRSDIVSTYIDKLRSSEDQNELFDQVMRGMLTDKRARLAEVRAIASEYLGFQVAKKKTKADMFKAIADHQAFNARQMARGGNQL